MAFAVPLAGGFVTVFAIAAAKDFGGDEEFHGGLVENFRFQRLGGVVVSAVSGLGSRYQQS